jgi:hypothetical protein
MNSKTRIASFIVAFVITSGGLLQADTVHVNPRGDGSTKLNPRQSDFVRENLVHIFDSAHFHQMDGGSLAVKTGKEIKRKLDEIRTESHIELNLDEPARIVVEGTELKAETLWSSIRESDGFVNHLILQRPDGTLVSLAKPRGELIVQFAPHMLRYLEQAREQAIDGNGESMLNLRPYPMVLPCSISPVFSSDLRIS